MLHNSNKCIAQGSTFYFYRPESLVDQKRGETLPPVVVCGHCRSVRLPLLVALPEGERGAGVRMAAVQCSKCTAERKGFRRELDSWRHRLIHCVGMNCEPEEVDDWSPETSRLCQFSAFYCILEDYRLIFHVFECHLLFNYFDVFSDVTPDCDSSIPLVAQELMKKMIHQFAVEYASKCTNVNYISRASSPSSEASDAPLDLTVSRTQEEKEDQPEIDGALDLSKRNCATSSSNHKPSGRQHKPEYTERSWELSEGLLSKALKDIRSGRLHEQRAALLYGIPLQTLRQGLDIWAKGSQAILGQLTSASGDFSEGLTSQSLISTLGGEACLVLQKVAAWTEQAEIGGEAEENGDFDFSSSALTLYQPVSLQKTLPHCSSQLRDTLQPPPSPTPSLEPPPPLRIPQVRPISDQNRSILAENCSIADNLYQRTSLTEGTNGLSTASTRSSSLFKLKPPLLAQGCLGSASQLPHGLGPREFPLDESDEGLGCQDKDKQPRKKRGRYRQYDHEMMEEAITMVMAGRMSVSKAQGVYGVPHSTLEYKVKERTGTLKNPPKRKSTNFCSSGSGPITSSPV
uniref:Ligand dependent nuclear receptor corepressor-like n=1 Tax=Oryzias latipes TaxID=8090 RepID=A0A3P9H4C2_ORYLA